jgi:hypothetical protein
MNPIVKARNSTCGFIKTLQSNPERAFLNTIPEQCSNMLAENMLVKVNDLFGSNSKMGGNLVDILKSKLTERIKT